MSNEALLSSAIEGDRLLLTASGSWTAAHASELEATLGDISPAVAGTKKLSIDMSAVRQFDTFGAWVLERLQRDSKDQGKEIDIVSLPERGRGLFEEMHNVNRGAAAPPAARHDLLTRIEALGRRTSRLGSDLLIFANMFGALSTALVRVASRPRAFRFTSAVNQLDRVGWQAVSIILLITFLIGAIIAQQGIFHFRKFGAELYVVDMVGILVMREVAVLLVSIMVAGRSGSSYTAELGSMKMREEIDALRTMGFDPVGILILPRVLVLVCAVPLLTFLGSMAALYGGGLVAWLYGGMGPEIIIDRFRQAITLTHFEVGMIKAPFMGLVIGTVACSEGLLVKGSAESLGTQTTKSVVKSIFLVIVLDGIFAMFFASIGM